MILSSNFIFIFRPRTSTSTTCLCSSRSRRARSTITIRKLSNRLILILNQFSFVSSRFIFRFLNDLKQLQAWVNGGYVISNPSGDGEGADEEFSAEELAALEKEIAAEGGDEGEEEDLDFDEEPEEEGAAPDAKKKEL